MTDIKQILTRALVQLAPPNLRDKTSGEKNPVPRIEEAKMIPGSALGTFTVSLPALDERFDKVIFCLTDTHDLRACTLQNLIAGVTTSQSVSEAFSNTDLKPPFGNKETVTAACFLHDKNTDSWVATSESSGFPLLPPDSQEKIREA